MIFWFAMAFGLPLIVAGILSVLLAGILKSVVGQRRKRIPDSAFDFIAGIAGFAFTRFV